VRGVTRTFPATLRFRDPRGATRARATLILEKESGR